MRMFAGSIRDQIQVAEFRVRKMVDGGQNNSLPHCLDCQSCLYGGRGAEGMTNLGFVRRDGYFCESVAEDCPQALYLSGVPSRG